MTKEKNLTNQGPYIYKIQLYRALKAIRAQHEDIHTNHAHTHTHAQCGENTFLDVKAGGSVE